MTALTRLTLATTVAASEEWLAERSPHTRRAYRTDLAAFAAWTKAESVSQALYDLLAQGRVAARRRVERFEQRSVGRQSRNTINRRLNALKSFVAAAFRSGIVDWKLEVKTSNTLSKAAKKATAKRDMSGPTVARYQRLIAHLEMKICDPKLTAAATRDLAIIALLENPMLRRSEVSALDIGDIDLTSGAEGVTLVGKARTEPETLPMPPETIRAVAEWLKIRQGEPSAPLFVQIRKTALTQDRLGDNGIYLMTTKRGRQAFGRSNRRLNPHSLRRTGITILAKHIVDAGIPVADGMAVSRHKKESTFWNYVDRKQDRKRELVNAVGRQSVQS